MCGGRDKRDPPADLRTATNMARDCPATSYRGNASRIGIRLKSRREAIAVERPPSDSRVFIWNLALEISFSRVCPPFEGVEKIARSLVRVNATKTVP